MTLKLQYSYISGTDIMTTTLQYTFKICTGGVMHEFSKKFNLTRKNIFTHIL